MKKIEDQVRGKPPNTHGNFVLSWWVVVDKDEFDIDKLREGYRAKIANSESELWFGEKEKFFEEVTDFRWVKFSEMLQNRRNGFPSMQWELWRASRRKYYEFHYLGT